MLKMLVAAAVLAAAGTNVSVPASGGTVVVLLGALLSGSLAGAAVSAWRTHRLGNAQREEMETHAAEMAVSAMRVALSQRESDLAAALARIATLESGVHDLTIKIARLEATVAAGERALANATSEREVIQAQLVDTQRQLADALKKRGELEAQIESLNARVGGRRTGDAGP